LFFGYLMKRLLSILTFCLFVACCSIVLVTCKKEYSYEGGAPTTVPGNITSDSAEFSLQGSPGKCLFSLPAGSFIVGNSISANTVTISVNVVKPGVYNISTDTLDNIYFSASGRFSTTGFQNVLLKGHGSPDTALNLRFTPSLLTSHCDFPLSILPAGALAIYVIESNYGSANPCTYQLSGIYHKGNPVSVANTVRINVTAISLGSFAIATETVNGIRFYYSGSFNVTGSQYIFLQASGTPLNTGVFSFSPTIVGPAPLGGQSCGFTITVQ
jgi:hypothetical protein